MNSLWLLTLILLQSLLSNSQTAIDCTNNCQTQYPYPSTPAEPCCGCCGNGTCNYIPELMLCCLPTQSFCGCLSFRAYCSGDGFDTSIYSTFGTCYDPTQFFCSYDPSPNIWILCPTGYTSCESSSYYSCCAPGSVCTSTLADAEPICTPVTTQAPPTTQAPATSQAIPPTTASTLGPNQCGNQQCCIARSNPNPQTGDGFLQFNADCLNGGLYCVDNTGCQVCHSSTVPSNPTGIPICGNSGVNVGVCFNQACCTAQMIPNPTTGHGYQEYDSSCLQGGLNCVGNTGCKSCYYPVPNGSNPTNLPICSYA
jgi:hypothetical protein